MKYFPTLEAVLKHEEVIKYACCLSTQPEVLIEVLFLAASTTIFRDRNTHNNDTIFRDRNTLYSQIKSLYRILSSIKRDLPPTVKVDPLQNEHITSLSDSDVSEERMRIPSRLYLCTKKTRVHGNQGRGISSQ